MIGGKKWRDEGKTRKGEKLRFSRTAIWILSTLDFAAKVEPQTGEVSLIIIAVCGIHGDRMTPC